MPVSWTKSTMTLQEETLERRVRGFAPSGQVLDPRTRGQYALRSAGEESSSRYRLLQTTRIVIFDCNLFRSSAGDADPADRRSSSVLGNLVSCSQ